MITKLQKDALVASRFDLYKSSKHFKHLNLENLQTSINEEVESLCELSDEVVCLNRCNYFSLKDTVPDDYKERIVQIDENLFILAGIRFYGLDVEKPFISIQGNFNVFDDELIIKISKCLKHEFNIFRPHNFHIRFPQDYLIESNNFKIDRYTIAGHIDEIMKKELPNITDEVELIGLKKMNFYEDYLDEYNLLYEKFPYLKGIVHTESVESLNESAKEDLLFKIEINGKCAGVIAGFIDNYFGQNEVCILEELLFDEFRGKGLAVYVQRAFTQKLFHKNKILWGSISDLNLPSLKTALKNGRKITEIEYYFNLD